jgi:hypothetical protein
MRIPVLSEKYRNGGSLLEKCTNTQTESVDICTRKILQDKDNLFKKDDGAPDRPRSFGIWLIMISTPVPTWKPFITGP